MRYLVCVVLMLYSFQLCALEGNSSVYLVQIRDGNLEDHHELGISELLQVRQLADQWASLAIIGIYTSDAYSAVQTAQIINQYHGCDIISRELLKISPETLSDNLSAFKLFIRQIFNQSREGSLIVLLPKSLLTLFYNMLYKHSKEFSDFTYVKIEGNSKELFITCSEDPDKVFHLKKEK